MKTPKIPHISRGRFVLIIVILIQFALLAVVAWYLYWTRQDVNQQATLKISTLINKAVDGLSWPVPTDAKTGQIYIREAKLTLPPAPDRSYELYYNYTPAFPGGDEQVTLMDKQNVQIQEGKVLAAYKFNDVFAAVPKLQACARGYQLFFKPQSGLAGSAAEVFSKKLNDGRALYAYLDNGCTDNSGRMTPYLKQIQSY